MKQETLSGDFTREETYAFQSTVSDFLNLLQTISFPELDPEHILTIAISKRLTFYDASYVAAAETKRLTLVTDDATLVKAAEEFVETKKSTQV
jgi:predicted nucleic acid-binding protein